jgi:hypothetical protein
MTLQNSSVARVPQDICRTGGVGRRPQAHLRHQTPQTLRSTLHCAGTYTMSLQAIPMMNIVLLYNLFLCALTTCHLSRPLQQKLTQTGTQSTTTTEMDRDIHDMVWKFYIYFCGN